MQMIKPDIKLNEWAVLRHNEDNLLYLKEPRGEHETYITYEGIPLIRHRIYAPFESELKAAFTTRMGGVSKDHLASLNLSSSRGDDIENVRENYRRFAHALGTEPENMVSSDQVHETNIRRVYAGDRGKGIVRESDIRETDGLTTDEKGVCLLTFYADCVPVYFYDPVHKAIGLAHSGWRGTVADIAGKMVRRMEDEYGTRAYDLVCAIGPSICRACYEIGEDVAVVIKERYGEDTEHLRDKLGGKYMLDLHGAVRENLLNAGVSPEKIGMPDLCTCCNPALLFSHRASKGMRGNLAAAMELI